MPQGPGGPGSPGSTFFVIATGGLQGQKNAQAFVVGPMSLAQFRKKYGIDPKDTGIQGETNAGYPTRAAAQKAADAFNKSGQPNPVHPHKGPSLPNPVSGLAAIGDFFSRLSEASTWIRAGEAVLGLLLIAVGVARLTNAVPAATKIAKTVGAVAI